MGWEWRMFMPLINEQERHFLTSYDIEKRDDIYYVENDKIGVKKRYGEGDFEVKVMKDSNYFGAENYKKDIVPSRMGHKYTSYIAIQVRKERQKQTCYSNSGILAFETSFVCAKKMVEIYVLGRFSSNLIRSSSKLFQIRWRLE